MARSAPISRTPAYQQTNPITLVTAACQRLYRARRDALAHELDRHLPGAEVTGIAAGLHAIVTLPGRYGPEPCFLADAARAGVTLRPLSDYRAYRAHGAGAGPEPSDGAVRLVLGYAHLSPAEMDRAVRLLAQARAHRPAAWGGGPGTGGVSG